LRGFHLCGIDVDILLTGHLHQLIHDLVGHRPFDEPVAGHAVIAREVQRFAEPDAWPGSQFGQAPAGGLDLVGVDHDTRDDRRAGLERHPGHAGLAAVKAPVG
jgi:hypothetical protein